MVEHPWMRIPDLANMFGLMLGAFGIYLSSEKKFVKIIGIIALAIFMILFLIIFYLFLRDYSLLKPMFTKRFLGIPY